MNHPTRYLGQLKRTYSIFLQEEESMGQKLGIIRLPA